MPALSPLLHPGCTVICSALSDHVLSDGLRIRNRAQLQRVMEMGFAEAEAREALEKHGGDENAAVNSLLGM